MQSTSVFERHPKRTLLFVSLAFAALFVILLELGLRLTGNGPAPRSYQLVDRLVVYDTFLTDASGLFKANPHSKLWREPFRINRDGFRSPDFAAPRNHRQSILLLGDSFAWGASANPITSSFADLLRQEGYEVYNTGIPGVGPTQQEAVAQQYIPRLHPDYVIVAFYLGKLQEKASPMAPFHNYYYVTNAGWILGFDENHRPLSAEEAYRHYLVNTKQKLKLCLQKTAVGTLGYNFATRYRHIFAKKKDNSKPNAAAQISQTNAIDKYRYTFDCLRNIKKLALAENAQFYTVVIPILGQDCCSPYQVEDFVHAFNELNPIYLTGLNNELFTPTPDCHLTTQGHRFVCNKITQQLKNSSQRK